MPENGSDTGVPKYPRGLKARGKRLWRDLHTSADFTACPETQILSEEVCYLADEIDRLRVLVRAAGGDTRVDGYNGQPASMPEVDDLRKTQALFLSTLKSLRMPEGDDGKLTPSQIGRIGAEARWRR